MSIKKIKFSVTAGITLVFFILSAGQSFAAEWSGSGEAGLTKASGNTENENFNIGLTLGADSNNWHHDIAFKFFRAEAAGLTSADNISLDYIAKRDLTERSYLWASAGFLDDDFDGFTEQTSIGVGYGYHVFKTERRDWEVGVGIGYRDTAESIFQADGSQIDGKGLSSATGILRSNFRQKLTDNTEFFDTFKAEIGSENTFIENDASLLVAMNDKFSLKAGLLYRNNSDPAPGADDTDTITSLNLVYNFGVK